MKCVVVLDLKYTQKKWVFLRLLNMLPVAQAQPEEEAEQQPGHASGGCWGRRAMSGSGPGTAATGPAMTRSALLAEQHTRSCPEEVKAKKWPILESRCVGKSNPLTFFSPFMIPCKLAPDSKEPQSRLLMLGQQGQDRISIMGLANIHPWRLHFLEREY
jgi:hypothetical protein